MSKRSLIIGTILTLLTLTYAHYVAAQAEKQEPEFVRVNKTVEAMSYDVRGVRSGSWIEVISLMRHRATGACWIGSYTADGHLIWSSAPSSVCR